MKKENIVEETMEDVVTTVEEETETEVENESKFSKVISGLKKHGKKIAVGAVVVAGGLIGYALLKGSKSNEGCDHIVDDIVDTVIDVTDSYEEVND